MTCVKWTGDWTIVWIIIKAMYNTDKNATLHSFNSGEGGCTEDPILNFRSKHSWVMSNDAFDLLPPPDMSSTTLTSSDPSSPQMTCLPLTVRHHFAVDCYNKVSRMLERTWLFWFNLSDAVQAGLGRGNCVCTVYCCIVRSCPQMAGPFIVHEISVIRPGGK